MNNLLLRSLSGIVYVAIIVACILVGKVSFYCLTAFFIIVGTCEFQNLTATRIAATLPGALRIADLIMALCLWSVPVCASCGSATMVMYAVLTAVLAVAVRLCMAVTWASPHSLACVSQSFLGYVYLALPMSLLNAVYTFLPGDQGATLILLTFICIWINDTGAFCVGCTIGKKRLCERLSPKKSWEGFWGGFLLATIAMAVYAAVKSENIALYAIYGMLVSVLATIGDLFESLLKRTAGVKDSGTLIPGHGGILDRIDSFLFASYATVILVVLLVLKS